MTIINASAELIDLDGLPIPETKDGPNTTLRAVVTAALLSTLRGDENLSGVKKVELFSLAVRIHSGDEIDLQSEEISLIKERIGKAYPPLIVGRAYEVLDPYTKPASGGEE